MDQQGLPRASFSAVDCCDVPVTGFDRAQAQLAGSTRLQGVTRVLSDHPRVGASMAVS